MPSQIADIQARIDATLFKQESSLPGQIQPYVYTDLSSELYSRYATVTTNLNSFLNAIPYKDITSTISVWEIRQLNKSITGTYGLYDIQSSAYAIVPRDLASSLSGYKGVAVPFNLVGSVASFYKTDLSSTLNPIASVDLSANLVATGSSQDILSSAYPKVISVKSYIPISLLDHKNLYGYINQGCFGTAFKNLVSTIYGQAARDLRGAIFTVRAGNIVNLTSHINSDNYLVQDTIDVTITKCTHKTINIPIKFSVRAPVYTYDTIDLVTGRRSYTDLLSSVTGLHLTVDLASTVTAAADTSYYVDNVRPIAHSGNTNQTVLKLTGGKEEWRREVEIMFRTAAKNYYYLSHADKVAKYEDDSKWSFIVTGFDRLIDDEFDRAKVRSHYLVDLRNYDTVDAAIRDLIDRVSLYRQTDLSSHINATGGFGDLSGYVNYVGSYPWFKTINSNIYGRYTSSTYITSSITGI